ncbi:MAG: PIN domain-containing protein [Dehalococcoidia bacterium]
MRILFDTNVILDVMLDREPFADAASALLEQVENGVIAGYLSATTITTIHYLASKAIGEEKAQTEIEKLFSLFEVAPINRAVLEAALKSRMADFEDAVLSEAAKAVGVDGIVTRNIKDFKRAGISIYNPIELLDATRLQN